MVMNLSKVFSKKKADTDEDEGKLEVTEPSLYSLTRSEEGFYRHLYPKNTVQKLSVPQKLVVDVVKTSLQKKEFRQKAVPRLPTVIPKLFKSLRDPEASAKHFVEIINKDPVMSAAVLKLANSVYFNPTGSRIDEIERAVVKLGIDGLRSVLSAAVMQPIIQRNSAYFSQTGLKMWNHSLNCAVACEIIAQHRNMEHFKTYVMGLVHDIGKTTIFSELCKQFKANGEDVKPGYNAFVPIMKVLGNPVSFWIAKDWELPDEICIAIAEQAKIKPGAKVTPFAHVLYQANLVAEANATIRQQNKDLAQKILEELDLPENTFELLDQLSKEV